MAHHLLAFPSTQIAEQVAADLTAEGFDDVRTEPGHDGWCAVVIADRRLPVQDGNSTVEALRVRFQALADEHGGQYVESEPGEATSAASIRR